MSSSISAITAFPGFKKLKAYFTTRTGGSSPAPFDSLNLGYYSGDRLENVNRNWKIICNNYQLNLGRLLMPKQIHSNIIKGPETFRKTIGRPECDAVYSNNPGDLLAINTADCLPVLVYDEQTNTAAVIHAGWKGTASGILEKSLDLLIKNSLIKAETVVLSFGPCIQAEVYEVKEETARQFPENCIIKKDRSLYLDLPKANLFQALSTGVKPGNISISKKCAFRQKEEFFSFRRDGHPSGRMAAIIQVP